MNNKKYALQISVDKDLKFLLKVNLNGIETTDKIDLAMNIKELDVMVLNKVIVWLNENRYNTKVVELELKNVNGKGKWFRVKN